MNEHVDLRAATGALLTALARSRTGGIVAALHELRTRPDLPEAARLLLADGTVDEKAMALIALRGMSGARVVSVARDGLRDANPRVRALAVQVMAGSGEQVAGELAAMLGDPDPQVVLRAIDASPGAEGVPALLRRLITDPDAVRREAAIERIGRHALHELRGELMACLGDPSPRVRARAEAALGALGGPSPT